MDAFTLGSSSRLEIDVTVLNAAEDAFEATLYLSIPERVAFVNIERSEGNNASVFCSPPTSDDNVLRCDIGNPLSESKSANFRVLLQPNTARDYAASTIGASSAKTLDILIEVNSTNPELEDQLEDNHVLLSLPIRVETDLIIRG